MKNKYTSVNVISDCFDDNAKIRQMSRYASFLDLPVFYHGVPGFSSEMASGSLVDVIDSIEDRSGIVVVNVAPRHGQAKVYKNGTPFAVFWYKEIMIVTTISDHVLSLVKKLNLAQEVCVLELENNIDSLISKNYLPKEKRDQILSTQFRSFEYVPRLVAYLAELGLSGLSFERFSLSNVQDQNKIIWFIDNFGNAKTSLLPAEVDFQAGKIIETKIGSFKMYDRLKDVPDQEKAIIIGSSGIENKRFLELVIQGKSLAQDLSLSIGQTVL